MPEERLASVRGLSVHEVARRLGVPPAPSPMTDENETRDLRSTVSGGTTRVPNA